MMKSAYKEILSEEAASKIHHNFVGWLREVAVFGDGLNENDAVVLRDKVDNDYCIWCSNSELFVPDGKCSGAYIVSVDGKSSVVAHTRGRRFTRKSRLATCNE